MDDRLPHPICRRRHDGAGVVAGGSTHSGTGKRSWFVATILWFQVSGARIRKIQPAPMLQTDT